MNLSGILLSKYSRAQIQNGVQAEVISESLLSLFHFQKVMLIK